MAVWAARESAKPLQITLHVLNKAITAVPQVLLYSEYSKLVLVESE